MKKFWIALYLLVMLMAVWMIGVTLDHECNNSGIVNYVLYGKDCDFKVPTGYKLVYNSENKDYAIADLSYGDYFLYTSYRGGIKPMFSSIAHPSVFSDSCGAKGYLKEYLKRIAPTMQGYK